MARRLRACNPGRFNRRVTILEKTETQDEIGQPIEAWPPRATIWAEKKDIRARERFRADQEIASETTVFETRWLSWVTPSNHRLEHDGKTYDIEAVIELGFRERMELIATAVRL